MNKTPFSVLQDRYIRYLDSNSFETEYLLLADAETLELMTDFNSSKKMVVLTASRLEGVRLIDNYRMN